MAVLNKELTKSRATAAADAEAIRHLEEAITGGKHWYMALLEAIGLWQSAEEKFDNRTYRYLIDDEAFDWLLLAERLCEAVKGQLPSRETAAFLWSGRPPLNLSATEIESMIGKSKYHQYLNYFYGVTVEEILLLAVQEEVHKERGAFDRYTEQEITDEAFRRIYEETRDALLKQFRKEKSHARVHSMTLTELKEFTYWLFKYRIRCSEKARVASDTRKALKYFRRYPHSGLIADICPVVE